MIKIVLGCWVIFSLGILVLAQSQNEDKIKAQLKKDGSKDTLIITYDASKGEISDYPLYTVNQNGSIIFKIKDINIFRYSVSLTETHDNIINRTKLLERNGPGANIDPTLFNLTDLSLNYPPLFFVNTADTSVKKLKQHEIEISKIQYKIEEKKNEIQQEESKYLVAMSRRDTSKSIDQKKESLEDEEESLNNYLKTMTKGIIKKIMPTKKKRQQINDYIKQNKQDSTQLSNRQQKLEETIDNLDDSTTINNHDTVKIRLQKDLDSLYDTLRVKKYQLKEEQLQAITFASRAKIFNNVLKKYYKAVESVNELVDLYQRLISLLYSDKPYEEIKTEKFKIAESVTDEKNATTDDILHYAQQRFRKIGSTYVELVNNYNELRSVAKDSLKNIDEIFKDITTFNKQIHANTYQAFFMQLAKVYDAINESNFTLIHKAFILSDNADHVNFNFSAEPIPNLHGSIETTPINVNYNVKIDGGWKVDVSTGVFFNIGLNNHTYRFQKHNEDSTKVIKERNENLFTPFYGVLFNVYQRNAFKDTKWGISIGASTNTESLSYYTGLFIAIGQSERILFHGGIASTQVDRVIDKYANDEALPTPIDELPNVVPLKDPRPYRIGGFFGISFNFSDAKNKETISSFNIN